MIASAVLSGFVFMDFAHLAMSPGSWHDMGPAGLVYKVISRPGFRPGISP